MSRRFFQISLFFLIVASPCVFQAASNTSATNTNVAKVAAVEKKQKDEDARYRSAILFSGVLELIRDEYVDAKKVDYDKLTYAALRGMLNSLDPHSQFMEPDAYKEMQEETQGQFGGLGISVGMVDGVLTINVPVEGGPGFKAGVFPGDRILKINDKATKGWSLSDAVKALRGDPGTGVKITVYRPSSKEFREFQITRELINVPTVREVVILSADRVDPTGREKMGYIRITQFWEKTVEEFGNALEKLQKEGMTSLVIDLRNNPGGLLEAAVEVAGTFLPSDTVIVSTEGRYGATDRTLYYAQGHRKDLNLPLVVLVNGNSASGAEIVAGALKDMKRAIIVGETTFGKGSVQTVQPVDRSIYPPVALRLTTARYFTPSHKMIHEVGVAPDIFIPVTEQEEQAIFLRRSTALLSEKERQKIEAIRDSQLERAISILRGVRVYNEHFALNARKS